MKKKVHFIGICGKGMSALAIMMKQTGWAISGSDEGFYNPGVIYDLLKKHKINFNEKYAKGNIPKDTILIVIGKHAKLVPETNDEVKEAFASGIKIQSMPQALGDLALKTENTVVAGSFGKSSITSLLTWCLKSAKKDPSYFIAASAYDLKENGYIGKGKDFIMEGDEYPSANWDNTSKFLYLHPKNIILTSGEHDHFNIFKTEESYIKPFEKLVSMLPKDGLLVASYHGKNVKRIVKKAKCKVVFYGLKQATKGHLWYAENIKYGKVTTFDLHRGDKKIATLKTKLLGSGNIENIVGVSAFLLEKKLLSIKEIQKTVYSFKGISGRLDLKTDKSSLLVYESFGSSYIKAKSDLGALRMHFPKKKIVTLFEPHTFSWRDPKNLEWYKDVFKESDEIIVLLPPETHGKNLSDQLSLEVIIKEIKKNQKNTFGTTDPKEVMQILKERLAKEDILVLMSSGDLHGLIKDILPWVEKKFPK